MKRLLAVIAITHRACPRCLSRLVNREQMLITHEGTGPGLPIIREFMKLHGGTLEIETELGRGTTVILTFPAERTAMSISRGVKMTT
jgi:signal transduction histidine kinase